MKKALKEIIESSVLYELNTPLDFIYIINTNKLYRGFWGKNGYNNIIFIGYSRKTQQYYHFDFKEEYQRDVLNCLVPTKFNIDIPHDLNCIKMFFDEPIALSTMPLSSFLIDKTIKENCYDKNI